MIAAFYAGFINQGTRNAKKDAEIKVLGAEKAGKIGIGGTAILVDEAVVVWSS